MTNVLYSFQRGSELEYNYHYIQYTEIKEYDIKNEYDNQELLYIMKDKNSFIKGMLLGVSKITACKNNNICLFVSPYNKLCQDLRKDGHNAITLNQLLGQGIDDHMKIKRYDTSGCRRIVFDEILLSKKTNQL